VVGIGHAFTCRPPRSPPVYIQERPRKKDEGTGQRTDNLKKYIGLPSRRVRDTDACIMTLLFPFSPFSPFTNISRRFSDPISTSDRFEYRIEDENSFYHFGDSLRFQSGGGDLRDIAPLFSQNCKMSSVVSSVANIAHDAERIIRIRGNSLSSHNSRVPERDTRSCLAFGSSAR